jgi:hypothetical protein
MRRVVTVAAFLACLAAFVAVPPGASQATPTVADGTAAVTTYTLVTGDRVALAPMPDGRPSVTLLPDPAGAGSFQVMASGPHLYVLPHDAAGLIGQPLSLDLFDVNALTPDGPSTAAPQPELTVDYLPGSARRLPPGLREAGDGGVTVSDPKAFRAALARHWTAEKRGTAPDAFAGIARIAPAGSARPAPPPGELFTVRVKAFDRRGQRAGGDVGVVMNADNSDTFLGAQSYYRGEFAMSVPAGHYSISSYISTVHPDNSVDFTLVTAPEVAVSHDTVVVLDARKGNRVSASTPRASTPVYAELNYQRNPAAGPWFLDSFTTFDDTPLYAAPTAQVEAGQLHFYPYFRLAGAEGESDSYLYDLEFPYAGAIPADLTRTVTADQLATIDSRYHSPIPGRAEVELRIGTAAWQALTVGAASLLAAPVHRTEYVTARSDLWWLQAVIADPQTGGGFTQGGLRPYAPGEHTRATWMAQPMGSGIQQQPVAGQACPVCRAGDLLTTVLFPFADNDGHFTLAGPTTREALALYRDGDLVGTSRSGFGAFPMSPDPASYRLVYDAGEGSPAWPTSAAVHTEWGFSSTRRDPEPLPDGWSCGGKGGGGGRDVAAGAGGGGGGGCSVEPLLFSRYTTSAGLDDVIPAGGPAEVDVTLERQRGAGRAQVGTFAAEVSYDDGRTWQAVPASALGDGVFRLSYTQPALDETTGYASLRIHASDDSGSAIDQTIMRAYPLAVTPPSELPTTPGSGERPVCSAPSAPPYTACMALVNTAVGVSLDEPVGLGPADIQSAYDLSPTAGAGRTVAVVDAYDNPNAEADLAAYREHYGLPACTSGNGCFTKVNQRGQTTDLPSPDPGWGLEIALDIDAVSAACPSCRILLVEADSASLGDLIAAVYTAQRLGADAISNSYGTRGEFSGERYVERYYRDLTVPFVVATGDYGYGNGAPLIGGVSYPSASKFAVAVGGTSLTPSADPRGWSESAWTGATSGCSAYIHKPGWQSDDLCGMRTVADVAAVADPYTGLAVYDTFGFGGWVQVGGTSLAAPIIASVYAMAGDGSHRRYAADLYRGTSGLYDITSGANGDNCEGSYLCTAVAGYDGPTGLGTPSGVGAF